VDEWVAALAAATARARDNTVRGSLALSYATRDIRQYRGTWPSALLASAIRASLPERTRYDARAVDDRLGSCRSCRRRARRRSTKRALGFGWPGSAATPRRSCCGRAIPRSPPDGGLPRSAAPRRSRASTVSWRRRGRPSIRVRAGDRHRQPDSRRWRGARSATSSRTGSAWTATRTAPVPRTSGSIRSRAVRCCTRCTHGSSAAPGTRGAGRRSQDDPVELDVGDVRFRLAGRIDRIDRRPDGTFRVIDYKTGRFWRDDYAGMVQGGRLLQHALYGRAAERLLARVDPQAQVSEAGYYFPCVRGEGELQLRRRLRDAELAPVLARLFDTVAAGAFVHTPAARDCGLCDLGRACGRARDADSDDGTLEQARRKLDNLDNGMLAPYRVLRDHE
jgi:hypothetical protein